MAARRLSIIITGAVQGLGRAVRDTESTVGKMGEKLKSIGAKVGKAMAGAGLAAGAALVGGVMSAMDQADMTSALEASLGVSPGYAADIGKAAGDAYRSGFGGSLEEAFTAAESVVSGIGDFLDPGAIEGLTEQALAMAKAFKVDVNDAMLSVGAMLENGLVKDAQEGMDVLTVGMQGVPQAVREEILAATQEYSKHFAGLGLSGAEAIRLFKSADGVIGVDKTADALKELSIRATDMSAASVAAYQAMGLNADAMSAKIAAGGPTAREGFDQIVAGLTSIKDPVEQANAAIALFGTPLEDLGIDQIPSFLGSLGNLEGGLGDVAGAADRMAGKMNSGPKAALEKFKRQVLGKLSDFAANEVIPRLEKLGRWLGEKLPPFLETLRPHVQKIADGFKKMAEKVGPVVSKIRDFVQSNPRPVLAALAVVIGTVLVGALWAMASAVVAAFAPFYAVVAVVALVAAGLMWAYDNVGWFRSAVDFLGRTVSTVFSAIWSAVSSVFGWIRDNWPLLLSILTGPIGWAVGFIVTHWDTIKNAFSAVKDWIADRVGDIVGFITGIPERIGGVVSTMWDGIKTGVTTAKDWVGDRIADMVGFITGLPGRVADAASGMWDGIKTAFKAALNGVVGIWNSFRFPKATFDFPKIHIPGTDKDIGGGSFTFGGWALPQLPTFHTGGTFRAPTPGGEGLALLRDGEHISTPTRGPGPVAPSGDDGATYITVNVKVEGSIRSDQDLATVVVDEIRRRQRRTPTPLF